MTEIEVAECMSELAQLFPEADLQDAELKVFGNALRNYSRGDGLDVIRTHRLTNDSKRPRFKAVLGMLGERKRKAEPATVQQHRRYRYVDELRKDLERLRPGSTTGHGDAEVMLRVGRGWFVQARKEDTGKCSPARQADITRILVQTLTRECQFDEESAVRWAECVFDDQRTFEMSVDELRAGRITAEVPAAV